MSGGTSKRFRDVTELCLAGAAALDNNNSFIAIDGFALKDTMAAVELMDKKMDQCCGLEGSIDLEELLTPVIPGDDQFDMDSLLNILRVLLVYEAGFLDGASVLESTHTCVYLWEGSWAKMASVRASFHALYSPTVAVCTSHYDNSRRLC